MITCENGVKCQKNGRSSVIAADVVGVVVDESPTDSPSGRRCDDPVTGAAIVAGATGQVAATAFRARSAVLRLDPVEFVAR